MTSIVHGPAPSGRAYLGRPTGKPIDAAKEAVRVEELAERLCPDLKRAGANPTARCPIPDHEDRTPSFFVYPESSSWWCYGCSRGGDVVDLAALAWNIEHPAVAAAEVLMSFEHEVPQRPQAWYRRQERQKPMREKIADVRMQVLMRRLFRWVFEPMLADIEDDEERARAGAQLWTELLPLAARMVEDRKAGG